MLVFQLGFVHYRNEYTGTDEVVIYLFSDWAVFSRKVNMLLFSVNRRVASMALTQLLSVFPLQMLEVRVICFVEVVLGYKVAVRRGLSTRCIDVGSL